MNAVKNAVRRDVGYNWRQQNPIRKNRSGGVNVRSQPAGRPQLQLPAARGPRRVNGAIPLGGGS